ncbi:hypothetical protein O6H91_21G035300 [Diphasiastrum complanatum]|uniref:Uncharacterized protein n=1 Tax=Diphasiastrum complanatum TaxID=34168 RepID=A0ACC2AJF7_DIPCM|nr:hypothetical protein O6H91_Y404700 [Diphasiastrum complanatum]KAJ7517687.1 hypothetical protein O6H91_21G035300 [Diphasiastrum complanatum]
MHSKSFNDWTVCVVLIASFSCITDGLNPSKRPLVPSIIIFGDSTVDAGNNNYLLTVVKSDFPPYGRDFDTDKATGRFCNGRLVTDYIASLVGLPFPPAYLDPEAKGEKTVQGICFASSASGYYDGTAENFNVVSLTGQLKWYQDYLSTLSETVGKENASSIISKAVFILSTGSNDYVNNYYINLDLQKQYNLDQYQAILLSSYKSFVQEIYKSGARKIAVVSLPPLGCLPSQITLYGKGELKCIEFQNEQAFSFNQNLQEATNTLKNSLPNLRIAFFDIYRILQNVISEPREYGFSYTLKSCCGVGKLAVAILCNQLTPGTCSNASSYVFWDSFHPSDYTNSIIAKSVFPQAVKELLS